MTKIYTIPTMVISTMYHAIYVKNLRWLSDWLLNILKCLVTIYKVLPTDYYYILLDYLYNMYIVHAHVLHVYIIYYIYK